MGLEPFVDGMLDVGEGQSLFFEVAGAERGLPAVVLHGGPGSGCSPWYRSLFDLERSGGSSVITLETDDSGRFSGETYGLFPLGSWRIDASDAAGKPASTGGLGYAGPAEPIDSNRRGDHAVSVVLDARDPARLLGLELVLDATHSIEGRILAASGEPVRRGWNGGSRIWAVPAGEYRPYHDRPLATARGEVQDGGRF